MRRNLSRTRLGSRSRLDLRISSITDAWPVDSFIGITSSGQPRLLAIWPATEDPAGAPPRSSRESPSIRLGHEGGPRGFHVALAHVDLPVGAHDDRLARVPE